MPTLTAKQPPIAVIKIGGSVLTDVAAYERCAAFLAAAQLDAPDERQVAIVSAQSGETDRLESLARHLSPRPDAAALDLLWSTGELRSVALLTLCLQRLGIAARGLDVHECGLTRTDDGDPAAPTAINPLRIRRWTATHSVVVVPGFLARRAGDGVVNLGRGGSDLTAVIFAAGLNAVRCELVKDVPGYFDRDPALYADAAPITALSYTDALAMADEGCDLVQRAAIVAAQRGGVPLVVRSLTGEGHRTTVTAGPPRVCVPYARSTSQSDLN